MALKLNFIFNLLLVSFVVHGNILPLRLSINRELKKSLGYPQDSLLNFTELSQQYGYPSEEHTVLTEDGYILPIFRIRGRKCTGKLRRPPVILMHGLFVNSDIWLNAGPNAGLAYLLADACYDLWVGNQRGNNYSRRHVRLDPDKDPEFWRFTVEEIGYYDIPATIDYVLKYTREAKLNYIGYSQGGGTFIIMCSERPGYCDKANILIGLAPATRMINTKSALVRLLTGVTNEIEESLYATGIYEILAKGSIVQELFAFLCKFKTAKDFCVAVESLVDSNHPGSVADETARMLFSNFPVGTSVHNLAWYGQRMQSEKYQKFDFGAKKNLKIYGERQPPSFNLSAVSVPVVALYGDNDYIVDKKDVLWLVENLPNVLEAKRVEDPLWNHLDIVFSQNIKQLIFPKINEYLQKYTKG